jgi:hypothetical protein
MHAISGQRSTGGTAPSSVAQAPATALRRITNTPDGDLFGDTLSGPSPRTPGGEASDWWLPGPARLCVATGAIAVEVRKRRFAALPPIAIIGPTDRAHRIVATGGGMVSVAITPLGWSRLSRRAAAGFRNLVAPAEDVLRPALALTLADHVHAGGALCGPVLHDLLAPLTNAHRDEAPLLALAALVRDPASVQVRDLHDRLGISEARLRSLALRHFGSPAKILLRRARFLRSLAKVDFRAGHHSYADIDPSYHDVPHFLRDAHYFLGTTPRRFRLLSSQH